MSCRVPLVSLTKAARPGAICAKQREAKETSLYPKLVTQAHGWYEHFPHKILRGYLIGGANPLEMRGEAHGRIPLASSMWSSSAASASSKPAEVSDFGRRSSTSASPRLLNTLRTSPALQLRALARSSRPTGVAIPVSLPITSQTGDCPLISVKQAGHSHFRSVQHKRQIIALLC